MISGSGAKYVMDLFSKVNTSVTPNDDLQEAYLSMEHDHVGLWQRLSGAIRSRFARIAEGRPMRPETLDDTLLRLAATSPHLLKDIGFEIRIVAPAIFTPVGPGPIQVLPIQAEQFATPPAAAKAAPVARPNRSPLRPIPALAAGD